jgi:hypothetical protein
MLTLCRMIRAARCRGRKGEGSSITYDARFPTNKLRGRNDFILGRTSLSAQRFFRSPAFTHGSDRAAPPRGLSPAVGHFSNSTSDEPVRELRN